MVSFSKSSNTRGSITFLHMTLKNIHKRVRIPLTKTSKMPRKATIKVVTLAYDNHGTLNQLTLNLA